MKRRDFIATAGAGSIAGLSLGASGCAPVGDGLLQPGHIQHGVIFTLKHPHGSTEEQLFLSQGRDILTGIPVVRHFQVFRQVSSKNEYEYGFSMVFENREDYQSYNDHPDHVAFVQERWMKEVEKFLEIDFEAV